MSEQPIQNEHQSMRMMYGTYADILFVLFPFLVISMQRLWDGELYETLMRADLSIAAAILAGLAIGKFVLGLVTNRDLGRFKERIVFFIALTLFVVLGPAIILMLSITGNSDLPGFIAFVQPVLLIIAISLYTTAVSISNILTGSGGGSGGGSGRESGETVLSVSSSDQPHDEADPAATATPQNRPLAIPPRAGNEGGSQGGGEPR